MSDGEEVAIILSSPPSRPDSFTIDAFSFLSSDFNHENLDLLYLSACDPTILGTDSLADASFPYENFYQYTPDFDSLHFSSTAPSYYTQNHNTFSIHSHTRSNPLAFVPIYAATKKKYKPVAKRTKPHSGVPPFTEQLAESFAGRACGGILDLFVGYDERRLATISRDLTTFSTPFGARRLTTLPMGWTNSVPIFHDDLTYILQPEIPEFTQPFIDDVPARGPATRYELPDGGFETIPENAGIRRFVWEHLTNVNRIVQRVRYSGGTFSGTKSILCAAEYTVVGHRCTYAGRVPEPGNYDKVLNWGPCRSLSELTRKNAPFDWGPEQIAAQDDLKRALANSPALRPLDYKSAAEVILAVDTSKIAVGYLLAQCDLDKPSRRFYARFGSITLNDREAAYSQPKLELYGLFRSLKATKRLLIGIRNLVIEVDARYIRGMLNNPDEVPGASMNRWIVTILTFQFRLVHVPGVQHGPDGLSRRPPQPGDEPYEEEDEDWIDRLNGLLHLINPPAPLRIASAGTPVFTQTNADAQPVDIDIPRSTAAQLEDDRLCDVFRYLTTLTSPIMLTTEKERQAFTRQVLRFYTRGTQLFRHSPDGHNLLVLWPDQRLSILRQAHDNVGHKGVYATTALLAERFWWPHLQADVPPPITSFPAPPGVRWHVDTMHMPGPFKYYLHARCALTSFVKGRAVRRETGRVVGEWIFQDILCRWGAACEFITDNGTPFVAALDYLRKKYGITHIRISGYNSRANGIVKRPHYDMRQALFKAADGAQERWHQHVHNVQWANRITVRRRLGCSPFFAATGSHPLLPFDIVKATYLAPPPNAMPSTADLIASRARALARRAEDVDRLHTRVYNARVHAAHQLELKHPRSIRDFNFARGDLVLMRNKAIESALNRKMRPRYLGPYVILARNCSTAYIVCELNGAVLDRPIAAFRLVPYLARRTIDLAWLDDNTYLDISTARLREMEASHSQGDDEGEGTLDDEDFEQDAPER
ncbi:Transposon Tf2-1 polyprotein [Trametes pubescens]|uniref:Transposon Tf2-1 polyprotein n=1 Tax=Trametes pubescens TaxID=154538 RepID=A0A1M2VGD6_TRAPU|nr:Transposon Tf2-1 polyprotein [Trametes pubescens]